MRPADSRNERRNITDLCQSTTTQYVRHARIVQATSHIQSTHSDVQLAAHHCCTRRNERR